MYGCTTQRHVLPFLRTYKPFSTIWIYAYLGWTLRGLSFLLRLLFFLSLSSYVHSFTQRLHALRVERRKRTSVVLSFFVTFSHSFLLHRRVFLEHMTYYLVRTGGDFRFFPELPPWQWLAHMEDLRFSFLSLVNIKVICFCSFSLPKKKLRDPGFCLGNLRGSLHKRESFFFVENREGEKEDS